jgi:(2Fe-2S) ferredoxin
MTSTSSSKVRKRQRFPSAPLRPLASAYLIANSSVLAFSGTSSSGSSSPQHIVKICQNKDCHKRFSPHAADGSLVDVVRDLFPSSSDNTNTIAVESSGCLSQCGKGPNVCVVEADSRKERLFFGVDSASTAAAILDVSCDYDPPVDLILAADKISKAQIGKSACALTSRVLYYYLCPGWVHSDWLIVMLVERTHAIYRVADERYIYTMPRFRCYLYAILMSRDPPRLGCNAFGVVRGFVSVPSAWLSVGEGLDLLHLCIRFSVTCHISFDVSNIEM